MSTTGPRVPVAQILQPEESNGASIRAFLDSWEPDAEGFTDEIVSVIESMRGPQQGDQERTWS